MWKSFLTIKISNVIRDNINITEGSLAFCYIDINSYHTGYFNVFSSSPTFSYYSYFFVLFLLFSYFSLKSSFYSYFFVVKCQNDDWSQEKPRSHEKTAFTLPLLFSCQHLLEAFFSIVVSRYIQF